MRRYAAIDIVVIFLWLGMFGLFLVCSIFVLAWSLVTAVRKGCQMEQQHSSGPPDWEVYMVEAAGPLFAFASIEPATEKAWMFVSPRNNVSLIIPMTCHGRYEASLNHPNWN